MRKRVGRDHLSHEAGFFCRLLETIDHLFTLGIGGIEREKVVVVERVAPRTEIGELAKVIFELEGRTGSKAKLVARLPAGCPEAKGEFVVASGLRSCHDRHLSSSR